MNEPEVPAGFEPFARRSPLTDPWQPIYALRDDQSLRLGVWIREAHCNARGLAHGGLICALADNAMGHSLRAGVPDNSDPAGEPRSALTVGLAIDYLGIARIGQWLQINPTVLRTGKSLAFVECHVLANDSLIARGNATFRIG